MAEPGKAARFWGPLLVIFLPAVIGEAVFLALLAPQPGGGDATAELVVGGAVAGALALVSSLVFLRSGFKSLLHAVAAAVLVYPLWFAYAIVGCMVGQCGYS
jgi:hypothetical protein